MTTNPLRMIIRNQIPSDKIIEARNKKRRVLSSVTNIDIKRKMGIVML